MAHAVDAIAIYAPNFARIEVMEQIVAAVKARPLLKGVIVEKPLGRNMKEARRLVDLVREAKLLTAYFENQIFMRAIRTQREQLLPLTSTMGPLTLTRSAEEHAGPHEALVLGSDPSGRRRAARHGLPQHRRRPLRPHSAGKPVCSCSRSRSRPTSGLLKWGSRSGARNCSGIAAWTTARHPAEDFATGMITYRNPETGQS